MKKFDLEHEKENSMVSLLIIGGAVIIVLILAFWGMKYALGKLKSDSMDTVSNQKLTESEYLTENGKIESSNESSDLAGDDIAVSGSDEQLRDGQDSTEQSSPVKSILLSSDVEMVAKECTGIDVSKYQGVINWKKVADSGVEFAIIRVGFRTSDTGEIIEDVYARYNLQEACANGIKVGAYFFSTAVNEQEAEEEAEWVNELIKQYEITYPVAYNCEGYHTEGSRQAFLSNEERTDIAVAFLNRIYDFGYTPMFYASKTEMTGNQDWNMDAIENRFLVWMSWYSEAAYSQNQKPDYDGDYAIWQYTGQGSMNGIKNTVDQNVAYIGYESVAAAHDPNKPETVRPDYEATMEFAVVNYEATAKDETNLRDIPDQSEESQVMYTLKNGELVTVTGVSDSGWARVIFSGNTYYAVANLLTTDFTPVSPSSNDQPADEPVVQEQVSLNDDGIKTVFTDCNETVTPKIEVNLRKLPSVTNPDATVVATIKNGEYVTRTGYNSDYGWSRVEYNGQTLYCVSSYLWVVSQ